jgi:hypothetical protein
MNKIQQAYEQGLRVREIWWYETFWIKKHSDKKVIDQIGILWSNNWGFDTHPEKWEIWHEDAHLFKPTDIKSKIENHINQIQELLKQL